MPIREFFHLMQIVDDFDEASAAYEKLLSPQVFMAKSWSDFDKRWASLSVIGSDFVLEIMEPSKLDEDGQSPLPKFHRRHGQHWHSMSWFVDAADLNPMMDRVREHGMRVIDPYSAMAGDQPYVTRTFFTHPKETFGQLEFQGLEDGNDHRDPRFSPGFSSAYWRDEHPLGIERMSHITTIVSDLDRARGFYNDVLEAPVFYEETTADRRSAFVKVGTDTVVELARPTSEGSRLAADMARHGELPHSMTFKVRDLDAAARHVDSVGIGIIERTDDTILLDPRALANALVGFTTRVLPNDPRA
jgi:catechol 2,3-dioxygenase-like lactoylglutathione lyase family enzyme